MFTAMHPSFLCHQVKFFHSKQQTLISNVIVINKGYSSRLSLLSDSALLYAHCPSEKFLFGSVF